MVNRECALGILSMAKRTFRVIKWIARPLLMSLTMSFAHASMSTSSTVPDAHMVADIVPFTARSLLGLMEDPRSVAGASCRGLGFIHADLLDRHLQLSHQQVRSLILQAHAITRDPALGLACGARQTPVSWGKRWAWPC